MSPKEKNLAMINSRVGLGNFVELGNFSWSFDTPVRLISAGLLYPWNKKYVTQKMSTQEPPFHPPLSVWN